MRILHPKRLYMPAFSIVIVVFLLLIFIGVSTYQNFHSNRKRLITFIHNQGLVMLQALEAGFRVGILSHRWKTDAIGDLIIETGRNEDIAYLYLMDNDGRIVHQSDRPSVRPSVNIQALNLAEGDVYGSPVRMGNTSPVYEMVKRFSPFSGKEKQYVRHRCGQMESRCREMHFHTDAFLVLGLKMTAFEAAQKADLHHAFIMAGILILLGFGAIFFIFVIQNLYRVNRTLKETQTYIQQVVDNMANGLLSIDSFGNILSCNSQALDIFGINGSSILNRPLDLFIDFSASGISETLSRQKSIMDREIVITTKKDAAIPVALSVTPIASQGEKADGAVVILRDLREIKQLEKKVRQAEKLAAVGRLAAAVAHEIRNPLSSIRGFAQFLGHVLKDRPNDQEYAHIMVRELDRINRVVTDLLTFSRPMDMDPVLTDLPELIEHTIRLVSEEARIKHIRIEVNTALLSENIYIDPNLITQVLLNILLNALQCIPEGGGIEIGAAPAESDRETLLWVEDDGPGIPETELHCVFDPFFSTREKGTGLGLAIVQKIIENHRGRIELESPPPNRASGCRFTLFLPDH